MVIHNKYSRGLFEACNFKNRLTLCRQTEFSPSSTSILAENQIIIQAIVLIMSNFDKKFLSVLPILIFCSYYAFGQTSEVKGILTEAKSGESLPFANILVKGTSVGTTSGLDGTYSLTLDPGLYTLVFSFIGYTDNEQEVELKSGEVKTLDVQMGASAELLEQVVVTTNKSGIKIGESTISIALIQPSLIENSNTQSIDKVLEKVPGVNVIDGQANIRGGAGYSYGAGSRVLILMDDLPFLQGDAGFANFDDVPIENINQVEVLKGAASALYGSSALNGIINVRTAYPTSEPVTKVSFFNTIFLHPKLRDTCFRNQGPACDSIDAAWWGQQAPIATGAQLAHRQKFGNFDLVLGGNVYYSDGYRQEQYRRNGRMNINTRYRLTDNISFGLNANINAGRSSSFFVWENPYDGAYQPFSLNGTISSTTASNFLRYNLDPFFTYFDRYGNRHKFLSRYMFINNKNANNQGNKSDLIYGEYQYQRSFASLGGLNVVAGIVGQKTFSSAELFGNDEYTSSNVAGYAQADKKFFDKLSISAGLRFEANTITSPDSILNPAEPSELILNPEPKAKESKPVFRIGANYQAGEKTFLRASWGQGYRFPTIAEKYISTDIGGVIDIRPNPFLESETGWSAEIGIRQGVRINTWQGFFDASLFWTEYQDMMEFTFGGADPANPFLGFQSVNIDDTRIKGFEVSFTGTGSLFGAATEVLLGYTYIDPTYQEFNERQMELSTSDENILKYRFKHTVKIDAQTKLWNRFTVGAALQYNSFMEAIDKFFEEVEISPLIPPLDFFGLKQYREDNQSGSAVLDLRFGYDIGETAKVSFLINNITNHFYTIRPALAEAPINLSLRVDFNFGGK